MPDDHDDLEREQTAGPARKHRAPGESGRGDLSDTDRVGSHGQGLGSANEREPHGIASKGGGEMSSQGLEGDEGVDREQQGGSKRGSTRDHLDVRREQQPTRAYPERKDE